MATINKLPSGSWRVQIRLRHQRPISKTFRTKTEARDWARSLEGDGDAIDAFPDAEARKRIVGQAVDAYMLEYTGRDPSIIKRLSWWKEEYGKTTLVDFSQAKIKDGLRKLAREDARRHAGRNGSISLGRKRGPATVNRYLQAISSVLTWSVDQSWLGRNPALGIKRRKEPGGRVRWLKDDERKALLKACDESEWTDLGLLVRLALSTGARQGELLSLRWEDVDLKRGLAMIGKTKNEEPRLLPIVGPVNKQLDAKARPIKGGLIFPSAKDKDKPFTIRKHWDAAIQASGITNFRFHDLRHSAASYLAMNGATLLEIGDVLGHKTLAMVKRYSHLATEHKQQLAERVFSELVE